MNEMSVYKANSKDSFREHIEDEHEFRTRFERDRDRILYSKAFRRISGKTQVFLSGIDDHLRTRLTHTLEVAQIAKTIGKRLDLDIDLIEAISYGHDVGHTPFGHVAEREINYIMNNCEKINNYYGELIEKERGFKHNYQAIKIFTELEKINEEYKGLNLTDFTLWGILNHSSTDDVECKNNYLDEGKDNKEINKSDSYICTFRGKEKCCKNCKKLSFSYYNKFIENSIFNNSWSIEALVVRMADEIAQRHHDIEDGILSNLMRKEEVIKKIEELFSQQFSSKEMSSVDIIKKCDNKEVYLPLLSKLIVNFLVHNIIKQAGINLAKLKEKYSIESNEEFHQKKEIIRSNERIFEVIEYEFELKEKENKLQEYLKNRVLNSYVAQTMDGKGTYIIRQLFKAYITNPQQLPDKFIIAFYYEAFSKTAIDRRLKDISDKNEIIGRFRKLLQRKYNSTKIDSMFRISLLRTICDYISGMTDNYAYNQFNILYGTSQKMHY